MSEQVGSIYFDLDLDDKRFSSKLASAEGEARSFNSRVSNYFESTRQASNQLVTGVVAVGAALGVIGAVGVKTAADLETARQGFITLLGSAEKADAVINRIKKEAARTPFELVGLTQATQLLTSVTKDGDKALDIILSVGESLAAMGKGQAELDRIIINLQQIGSVGHASMVDIKQFAYNGIPIFEMLTQATGKTGDALADMISSGGVTFDMLIDMFRKATAEGGRFHGAFANQAGTFNQLMANMKDSFSIFLADVIKGSGIFDMLKKAMSGVINFMNANKGVIQQGLIAGMQWLKDNGAVVVGILAGALAPAVIGVVLAFARMLLTLSPFMVIGAALAILIPKLVEHFGGWHAVLDKTRQILAPFKQAASDFVASMGGMEGIIARVKSVLQPLRDGLGEVYRALGGIHGIANMAQSALSFLKDVIVIAVGVVRDAAAGFKQLWDSFTSPGVQTAKDSPVWMQAFAIAGEVLRGIVDALVFVFNGLWSVFSSIVAFVTSSLIPTIMATIQYMQQFGLIKAIIDFVALAVGLFVVAWRMIQPAVTSLIDVIMTQLLPALMNLWTAIAPVLMPVLTVLVEILNVIVAVVGGLLIGAIWLAINTLKVFIAAFSMLIQAIAFVVGVISGILSGVFEIFTAPFRIAYDFIRGLISGQNFSQIFRSIVDSIKSALSGAYEGIISPFKRAFDWIGNAAGEARQKLMDLNPFQRHSPSLVDWITRGTKVITDRYSGMFNKLSSLADSTRPALTGTMQAVGASTGSSITNNLYGVNIQGTDTADYWLSKLSYDDQMTTKGMST
jgi:tape measure domain-containing protein